MTTTTATYHQGSPSQQSLVLECTVCTEQYGPDFDSHPRSLRCGHTFCTSCLMKLINPRGVKCPVCNKLHPLSSPDVTLLPVNYAVQDIILSTSNPPTLDKEQCGVCGVNVASVICIDCSPGDHFKFCAKCDSDEHGRNFGPVQKHKRFPINEVPAITNMICSRHSVAATLYSESSDQFACDACSRDSDWDVRRPYFDHYSVAAKRIRNRFQRATKYTNDVAKRLTDAKQNLVGILSDLEPGSMEVKANITRTFSKCIELLQERQRVLLANVDDELANRKEALKKQHQSVASAVTEYRNAFQSLNSLLSKSDSDFLLMYRKVFHDVESLLVGEDQSLLRPLVNQDIPFCISHDIVKQLSSLGAVGGGLTPMEFECIPTSSRGTLMELFWRLPERCGKLNRFEIEYEQVQESNMQDMGDLVYTQKEPQFYEVPGSQLTTFVDHLCPNYTYRFRIRSANDAGFGMWSEPVMGKCNDFPFTLEYTKKIHRIIIPISGYYRITVKGAKGEDGMMCKGGRGAIISAAFSLKCGDILIMLVGGMSSRHDYHTGGGGGSFVAVNEVSQSSLLIAAGGGGGTRGADANDFDGSDANMLEDGFDGRGRDAGRGGKAGGRGEDGRDSHNPDGPTWGHGGAGFMENSSTAFSFSSGGHGGQNGGFGGGGAVGMFGGGGGGGYSGGGGGRGGGGGGSYVSPAGCEVARDIGNEGHGSICIERVERPYPASNSFLNRVPSANTESSNSSNTHLQRLESQISSSSLSNKPNTMASSGSVGTSVGTIPEHSDSVYQSPASTAQVMDRPDNLSPVMFSIDHLNGEDDPDVELIPRDVSSHTSNVPVQPATRVPDMGKLEEFGRYTVDAAASSVPAPERVMEVFAVSKSIPLGTGVETVGAASATAGGGNGGGGGGALDSALSYQPGGHPGVDMTGTPHVQDLIQQYQSHQISSMTMSGMPVHQSILVDSSNPVVSSGRGDPSTSQWVSQQQFDQDQGDHSYLATLRQQHQQQQDIVSQVHQPSYPAAPGKQNVSPSVTQHQQPPQHVSQAFPSPATLYMAQQQQPGGQPSQMLYTMVSQPGARQNVSPPLTQVQHQQHVTGQSTATTQLNQPLYPSVQQPGMYVVPQPGEVGRHVFSPPLTTTSATTTSSQGQVGQHPSQPNLISKDVQQAATTTTMPGQ